MNYTPSTNTNPAQATLGQFSPGVGALQAQLNAQNAGKPGWVPLVVDNKYGPLTQAGTTFKPANPGIVSSTGANNDLNNFGNQLDQLTNQPDPYMEALQKRANGLLTPDNTAGVEERNAAQAGAAKQLDTEKNYAAYKAGLQTLGIQTGLAPALVQNQLLNAANQEQGKLSDIQDKEDLAVARAKQARIDKNSTDLKSTLAEIKSLRDEKRQAINDLYTRRSQDASASKDIAAEINANLKNIPPDKQEAYINYMAQINGISNISALHNALIQDQRTEGHLLLSEALQRKTLAAANKAAKNDFPTFRTKPTGGDISKVQQYLVANQANDAAIKAALSDEQNFYKLLNAYNQEHGTAGGGFGQ